MGICEVVCLSLLVAKEVDTLSPNGEQVMGETNHVVKLFWISYCCFGAFFMMLSARRAEDSVVPVTVSVFFVVGSMVAASFNDSIKKIPWKLFSALVVALANSYSGIAFLMLLRALDRKGF